MDILKTFEELARSDRNPYLEEARGRGRKVIGYFCSYVPEEVIHAAGLVPYRMRAVGSQGTSKGDIYYSPLNCTFVRHCFDKVIRGDYGFLDGVVFLNGCDHVRRMYDNWRHAGKTSGVNPDYLYMFIAPHLIGENAYRRYDKEIRKLINSLQERFGVSITGDSLKESVKLYNKKRRLLGELYARRMAKDTPINGSEILAVMLAVTALPVETAVEMLEELNKSLGKRVVSKPGDLRIFISAGCMEELDHLAMIEESGSVVVADNLCNGARHFILEAEESGDPINAISRRYLSHLSCPRMMNDLDTRIEYLKKTINDYKVDAVIAEKLKFCDLWGGELFVLRREAKKEGIPILVLERELHGGGTGELKNRIQAFFEKVRNKMGTEYEMVRSAGGDYKGRDEDALKYR